MNWCVCECKPLSYFPLNWLRDHTSWALVELEWKLKVVLSTSSLWFLNFTTLKYALLFLNSKIYIVHVIDCEWSRSVIFPLRLFCMRYKTCIFPTWCTPPPPNFCSIHSQHALVSIVSLFYPPIKQNMTHLYVNTQRYYPTK